MCLPTVIHGTIHGVVHDIELQESIITITVACFSTRLPLFQVGGSGSQVQASICTPVHCGVSPGQGTFLFMDRSCFGDAWLGCAPTSRNSAIPMQVPMLTTSTPGRCCWIEGAWEQGIRKGPGGGWLGRGWLLEGITVLNASE